MDDWLLSFWECIWGYSKSTISYLLILGWIKLSVWIRHRRNLSVWFLLLSLLAALAAVQTASIDRRGLALIQGRGCTLFWILWWPCTAVRNHHVWQELYQGQAVPPGFIRFRGCSWFDLAYLSQEEPVVLLEGNVHTDCEYVLFKAWSEGMYSGFLIRLSSTLWPEQLARTPVWCRTEMCRRVLSEQCLIHWHFLCQVHTNMVPPVCFERALSFSLLIYLYDFGYTSIWKAIGSVWWGYTSGQNELLLYAISLSVRLFHILYSGFWAWSNIL